MAAVTGVGLRGCGTSLSKVGSGGLGVVPTTPRLSLSPSVRGASAFPVLTWLSPARFRSRRRRRSRCRPPAARAFRPSTSPEAGRRARRTWRPPSPPSRGPSRSSRTSGPPWRTWAEWPGCVRRMRLVCPAPRVSRACVRRTLARAIVAAANTEHAQQLPLALSRTLRTAEGRGPTVPRFPWAWRCGRGTACLCTS